MSESQESFISTKQPLQKDSAPFFHMESNKTGTLPPEAAQADLLRETRENIKRDYPSQEFPSSEIGSTDRGYSDTPFKEPSRFDLVQQKIATTGARILTSSPFVPNYTDGKGNDDNTEVSWIHRLTRRHVGGPPTLSFLLKLPIELIKKKIGK